jgi:hypothetical protein
MIKHKKLEKLSYKYIPCINTEINTSKYWFGRLCDNNEVHVDSNCFRVVCGTCIAYITSPGDPSINKLNDKKLPKGWKLYSEFVDSEGNVYFKGVEQVELKGTKEPTIIIKKEKIKKDKVEKVKILENGINKSAEEIKKLKKMLKESGDPKERKIINLEIKKLSKG